ncbi:lantibiotic dehydratase [Ekhidna sp.]
MDLFPYTLARLGGDTFDQWQKIQFTKTNASFDNLIKLKSQIEKRKGPLCEHLLSHMKNLEDSSAQNNIQNVRRKIFNDRTVKAKELDKIYQNLPINLRKELDEYLESSKKLELNNLRAEEVYEEEILLQREELKEIVKSDVLRKGLLLSSKSLLNQLESYISKPAVEFRKKEFQTEKSLLQYLSRIYTKTSPFSTFTNLAISEFKDSSGFQGSHSNEPNKVSGHIRLNNLLLKYLFDLFKNYRDLYILLPLRPNPTITLEVDSFVYLTNHNNIESFQRIPQNPVIDYILNEVSRSSQGFLFGELINKMVVDVDADPSEIEDYVKQLLDFGFLEYNFQVSGVDPDWDKKLASVLHPEITSKVPIINELIEQLKKIRNLGVTYAQSELNQRKAILEEAFQSFRSICMKIHKKAGLPEEERETEKERLEKWNKRKSDGKEKTEASGPVEKSDEEEAFRHETYTLFSFKPEQIFYEDTIRNSSISLNKESSEQIIGKLAELLNHLRLFKGHTEEKEKMKTYFLEKFPQVQPNVLTFYESYYRDIKKPEKEVEEKKKEELNAKKTPQSDELSNSSEKNTSKSQHKNISQSWQSAIKEVLNPSPSKTCVEIDDIKKLNSKVGFSGTQEVKNSYGAFLQFFEENGEMKAVVNSTFSGYGKMLSRFLHIFDDEVTDTVRKWNESQCNNALFAEDCDSSYFNANLHPPLMPFEIRMPGSHNSLDSENQIPVTDLKIKYDDLEDRLKLVSKKKKKEVNVFDLGFQGHLGRSQLFLLLEKFTKAEHLSPAVLVQAINNEVALQYRKKEGEQNKTLIFPRIVYGDQLILQRKTWTVAKEVLPFKESTESGWQSFRKVNEWRLNLNLPEEVFVFINPARWSNPSTEEKEAMKKLTKDDYKPQYIDFTNPFLVSLFQKLINRVPKSLKITEMLPSSRQLLKIDNEKFVSEFMMQWYNHS